MDFTLLMWTPYVEPPTWTLLRGPWCGPPYVEPPTWTLLVMWTPPRGAPYVDPACVDPPTSLTWTLLMWTPLYTWTLLMSTPLRGAPYVDPAYVDPATWSPTWTLLRGMCLCGRGAPYTWTLLHGPGYVDPSGAPYVDSPTAPYVDSLTWTLLMWTPLCGAPNVVLCGESPHVREST